MHSSMMKKRETGLMQKTKYLKQVLLLTACMVVVAACSSSKPQVNMDETQNFADIKTFYIQPPPNPINATLANHLSSAITQRLIEKGLTPSSEEDADIAVGYLPSTTTKEDGTTLNLGLAPEVTVALAAFHWAAFLAFRLESKPRFNKGFKLTWLKTVHLFTARRER